jgi:hypothetical protein
MAWDSRRKAPRLRRDNQRMPGDAQQGTDELEETMTETKERTVRALDKVKGDTRRGAAGPTCRTILMAASVGVLIGLLLKR